jgi:hypothetical protein
MKMSALLFTSENLQDIYSKDCVCKESHFETTLKYNIVGLAGARLSTITLKGCTILQCHQIL